VIKDPFQRGQYRLDGPQPGPVDPYDFDLGEEGGFADLWVSFRRAELGDSPQFSDERTWTIPIVSEIQSAVKTIPDFYRRDDLSLMAYAAVDWHRRHGHLLPTWAISAIAHAFGVHRDLERARNMERMLNQDAYEVIEGAKVGSSYRQPMRGESASALTKRRALPSVKQRMEGRLDHTASFDAETSRYLRDPELMRALYPDPEVDAWIGAGDAVALQMHDFALSGQNVRLDVAALFERLSWHRLTPTPVMMRALAAALGIATAEGPKAIPLCHVIKRRRFMRVRAVDRNRVGQTAEQLAERVADSLARNEADKLDVDRIRQWRNMPLYRFREAL